MEQEKPGGIAEALGLTRHFAGKEKVVVILGDNVIQGNLRATAGRFEEQSRGAKILLSQVANPQEYGVAVLENQQLVGIEEKPSHPKSDLAVIGIYFYDPSVFEIVTSLQPSKRGELEITDVNNAYIRAHTMTWEQLPGWWGDAGESIDALLRVSNLVAKTGANLEKLIPS